ncbi:unnamed protein product [Paramecium sonneborni]|uniref:Protein kinase domain-containing protein n=1 Tax=Paramecium sonneborni TaxID=65129 RepID=A0A8S1R9W2_9CILI|nr:unnamed protein product [Paramecium sonneborni]
MNQFNVVQRGNYIIHYSDVIAEGVRGKIYRCERGNQNEQLCVQVICKTPNYGNQEEEMNILKKLKNAVEKDINILKIYDIDDDDTNYFIYTELCDKNLQQLFEEKKNSIIGFTQQEITDYIGQIVRGYQYLRKLKIMLRDLTPKSILIKKLSNNRIVLKLSDFAISCMTDDGYAQSRVGIPLFAAPEVYSQSPNQQKYNDSCDIYSLGVILYMMQYNGDTPGIVNNLDDLKNFHEKLKNSGGFKCKQPKTFISDLIEKMLNYYPEKRPSWDQLDRNLAKQFLIFQDIYFVDLDKQIGQGAQGVTHYAYDLRNNQELVCKIIANKHAGTSREIQIFEQIKGKYHENVIKTFAIFKQTESTYLIMEKGDRTLQNYLEDKQTNQLQLKTQEIVEILYQVVQGYIFLKQLGIIHRDLKPDNLLLKMNDQGKYIVKIIDFGVGKIIGKEITATDTGTPIFCAPEVLQHGRAYDYQCDIYSLGVMLHYLAFQRMFKDIGSLSELMEFHRFLESTPFQCQNHENPYITELINKMIVYDPQKRINWEKLQAHKIFDSIRSQQPNIVQNQIAQQLNHYPQQNQPKQIQMINQLSLQPQQQQQNQQQQLQPIPPPTFTIYQYIWSLHILASKTLQSFGIIKENNLLHDEILLSKQFIIEFIKSCLNSISYIQNNKSIQLDGVQYRITPAFDQWFANITFNKAMDQILIFQQQLNQIQTNNKTFAICQGETFFKEIINQGQPTDFLHCHRQFNKFYQLIKPSILSSNLDLNIKFFMGKLSNVFIEFPIQQHEKFSEQNISQKIIKKQTMEDYVRKNQ